MALTGLNRKNSGLKRVEPEKIAAFTSLIWINSGTNEVVPEK